MKTVLIALSFFVSSSATVAQTHDDVVVARAKEYHKVLTVKDKDLWRRFMKENYTKALLERPVKARINDNGETKPAEENEKTDPVEAKLLMFERLNADFGNSTITSIKPSGDQVQMVLTTSQMSGTFRLTFDKSAPFLIDGIAVEVGMEK